MLTQQRNQFVDLRDDEESNELSAHIASAAPTPVASSAVTHRASIHELRRARGSAKDYDFYDVYAAYVPRPADGPDANVRVTTRYPASLYGPYHERMLPRPDGSTPTFDELCRETAIAAPRKWGEEWAALSAMATSLSLSAMGTRLRCMNELADAFAAHAGATVSKLIDERHLSLSQRAMRPLAGFDWCVVHAGCVFVNATSAPFVKLHGTREAAQRAALNEVRAMKAALGAVHIVLQTPLCACVTVAGVTFFASAPLPIAATAVPSHGCLSPKQVYATAAASYTAYQLGEYFPLQRHSISISTAEDDSDPPTDMKPSETLFTAFDVKQYRSSVHDATFLVDAARWLPPAVALPGQSQYASREDTLLEKNVCRHPLEDAPRAHLNVLFRPEFMRMYCPLGLNPDAGTPSQPAAAQKDIGYAVMILHTKAIPPVRQELLARYAAGTLLPEHISDVFHAHGVNLRYMGRVCSDLAAMPSPKNPEARDGVVAMLEREMAARTWKAIVLDALQDLETRPGSSADTIIISYLKSFVLSAPDSESFWSLRMEPRMQGKYGYECRPVVGADEVVAAEHTGVTGTKDTVTVKDTANLQVYHALKSAKMRVEAVPCPYDWVEKAPGQFGLSDADVPKTRGDAAGGNAAVLPLIGITARANSAVMFRALALLHVDISSDMRGKKIFVHARPNVKACTALVLSDAVAATATHAPATVAQVLALDGDDASLCAQVATAAERELNHFTSMSDSDPRVVLPMRMLALAQMYSGDAQVAYLTATRWLDLRRASPHAIVAGVATLECGLLLAAMQRLDRAETVMVDGLKALKAAVGDTMDNELVARWLHRAAGVMAAAVWADLAQAKAPPPVDRVACVFDYLEYACRVFERLQHPDVPRVLVSAADFRKRLAKLARCCRCHNAAATMACGGTGDDDSDHMSSAGATLTRTAATAVTTASSAQPQAGTATRGGRGRRRRDDAAGRAKQGLDDDGGEVFVKTALPPMAQWLKSDKDDGTASKGDASVDLPQATLMRGVAAARTAMRPSRYWCDKCYNEHRGEHSAGEPLQTDVARLLARAVRVARHTGRPVQPAGDSIEGDALVSLGVLQGDPALVVAGTAALAAVYGEESRPVIHAELRLAEVLLARSIVHSNMTTTTRDAAKLYQAEDGLHGTLAKLLKRSGDPAFAEDLTRAVGLLQATILAYNELPTAKREHAGIHNMVDTIFGALGPMHRLTGNVLEQVTHYYLKLASLAKEATVARSTALLTAGKYGVQWLECVAASEDVAMIEAALRVIRDDIVRALRGGSSTDRAAAQRVSNESHSALHGCPVSTHPTVVAAVTQLDDVFKTQLKVVEETAQSAAFAAELTKLRGVVHDAVSKITAHEDRGDIYSKKQMARIDGVKARVNQILLEVRDTDIRAKAHALLELHASVTRTTPATKGDAAEAVDGKKSATVAYESPYALLPGPADDHEDPLAGSLRVASSAVAGPTRRGADNGPRSRAAAAAPSNLPQPAAADLATKDRPTQQQLRRSYARMALGASRKTFERK